jgi:ABC-type Fe3+/spermidine/putrescine transport system ATPase subunit
MAVSDRIAILSAGTVQQVGRPEDIYFAPVNRFTAEFMGACNLLSARARGLDPDNGLLRVEVGGQPLWLTPRALPQDGPLTLLLRPDWITLCAEPEPGGENRFPAGVRSATFLGALASYQMEALGQTLRVDGPGQGGLLQPGDQAILCFDPARPALLPA